MNLITWAILILLATIPAWIFKKYLKVETSGPIVLWRTKKGKGLVKKLAKYSFFTYLADLGLIFSFGVFGALYLMYSKEHKHNFKKTIIMYLIFIISAIAFVEPTTFMGKISHLDFLTSLFLTGFGGFVFYSLIWSTWLVISQYLSGGHPIPMVQPIIPGVDIPGAPIKVPLSALIGMVLLIIVHEFSHGIVAIREKIKLKSLGLATLGIFPIGAFAEPDEKQLEKASMKKRTRVYSAGSMANFALAAIFLIILIPSTAILTPSLANDYKTKIITVEPNSPADLAGLKPGMELYGLNFVNEKKTPNTPITLKTSEGKKQVMRNNKGMIGITYDTHFQLASNKLSHWLKYYYLEIITWTGLLNLLVGMFNYLPFAIFDGARIFEDLINFFNKTLGRKGKPGRKWLKATTWILIIMFVINFLPYFIK